MYMYIRYHVHIHERRDKHGQHPPLTHLTAYYMYKNMYKLLYTLKL